MGRLGLFARRSTLTTHSSAALVSLVHSLPHCRAAGENTLHYFPGVCAPNGRHTLERGLAVQQRARFACRSCRTLWRDCSPIVNCTHTTLGRAETVWSAPLERVPSKNPGPAVNQRQARAKGGLELPPTRRPAPRHREGAKALAPPLAGPHGAALPGPARGASSRGRAAESPAPPTRRSQQRRGPSSAGGTGR